MRFQSTDSSVRPDMAGRGYGLVAVMAAAGIVLGCGLLPGNGSTSRADDPPKPAEVPDASARRINAQRERFLRIVEPLADVLEEAAEVKERLPNQSIAIDGAKAAYQNAKLTREVAEIALIEYEAGEFKQELTTVDGRVTLAKSQLDRVDIAGAERRLENTLAVQKAFDEAKPEPAVKLLGALLIGESVARARASVEVEKIKLRQAELERESAERARDFLHRFTRPKRVAELKSNIEKAKSGEREKELTWELAVKKQKLMETIVSEPSRSWSPAQAALLSIVAEVGELETRRADLLDRAAGPRPPDGELQKLLDAIDAKLDGAERAADRVRIERTDRRFFQALSRVNNAARGLRKGP